MKKVILLCLILSACGGNDSNIPSVAGSYHCVSGCSNPCDFSAIQITQNESTVVAANSQVSCSGSIDESGNYAANCGGNQTCIGTFAGSLFTANCEIGGFVCQQAAFQRN